MSGQWEPVNPDDDQKGFFGDVDGIVFKDTDSGPAELRYRGTAADLYDDVPAEKPAPQRRRTRAEGIWSPGKDDADVKSKKRGNPKTRAALRRLIPFVTMIVAFGTIGLVFWYVGGLVSGGSQP